MIQTIKQTAPISWESLSPKSSNFFFNGVSSSSSAASLTYSWTLPIAVCIPVKVTTPIAEP